MDCRRFGTSLDLEFMLEPWEQPPIHASSSTDRFTEDFPEQVIASSQHHRKSAHLMDNTWSGVSINHPFRDRYFLLPSFSIIESRGTPSQT